MTHQGKFDGLTKELITHVLGFEENEENFVRSEQYVLSNLLYHHCLAVNSHAVRRSIDGLGFKFTVHGQESRAQRLNILTTKFVASPVFKDHYETDIQWSLLSLMLHLSNSPTQVAETQAERNPIVHKNASPASSQDISENQIDWVAYLLKGEKQRIFGPEDPLSDWSDSDDEEYTRSRKDTDSYRSYVEDELSVKSNSGKNLTKGWNLLEQSHRAKSWISGNSHMPYWKGICYQQEPVSSRLIANVATLWEQAKNDGSEQTQQLSEWAVMREIIWLLMCPVSSYVFQRNEKGEFIVKNKVTVSSLTPSAMLKLLEDFCSFLNQLSEIDLFIRNFESPDTDPPTPVTLLAYVWGLRQWRSRFQEHLSSLEKVVKKQECTTTMIWLQDELTPWFRMLSSIYAVHYAAVSAFPENCSRNVSLRLIGSLCEGVEGAGEAVIRSTLMRLLLYTLRHYFLIMHNWLLLGELVDFANEFLIHRAQGVAVTDETFWREAFILNCHPGSQGIAPGDPLKTGTKILLPLAVALTSIGKSQELLSALTMKPIQEDDVEETFEKPLEELLVEYVIKYTAESKPGDSSSETDSKKEQFTVKECEEVFSPTVGHLSSKDYREEGGILRPKGDRKEGDTLHCKGDRKEGDTLGCKGDRKEDNLHPESILETPDLMLTEDSNDCNKPSALYEQKDYLDKKIEALEDIPRAVSFVGILSSALRPLITEKQNKLNVRLMDTLMKDYWLDRHCRAVRSILLMEAGDIMHEFYSHLFNKLDMGESVDSVSLSLHLEYCIARLYPDLAKLFSVSVESKDTNTDEMEDKTETDPVRSAGDKTTRQLSALGLPDISIHYQAPWPINIVFTQDVMTKFNQLFRFSLSLKRATTGLERLKFKDMASWNVLVRAQIGQEEEANNPLQSRLHRLQLLRLWLLSFARELHNYFANVVFMPYHRAFDELLESKQSFSVILSEHNKLLNRVLSFCLMGNESKVPPLQVVLNKVFSLTQQLGHLWIKDIGRVTTEELSSLEAQYVQVHRFIVNLLTHLTSTRFLPHLEGMARSLANTMPLQTL